MAINRQTFSGWFTLENILKLCALITIICGVFAFCWAVFGPRVIASGGGATIEYVDKKFDSLVTSAVAEKMAPINLSLEKINLSLDNIQKELREDNSRDKLSAGLIALNTDGLNSTERAKIWAMMGSIDTSGTMPDKILDKAFQKKIEGSFR